MGIFNRNNEGYSRGGMDVESAVNLFFKGVLLFPSVFVCWLYWVSDDEACNLSWYSEYDCTES